jgi:hypothetical protein
MSGRPHAKANSPSEKLLQPAEFVEIYAPLVRDWHGRVIEIDYSWSQKAVVMHDLQSPAAIRRQILMTDAEIAKNPPRHEVKRRVDAFVGQR